MKQVTAILMMLLFIVLALLAVADARLQAGSAGKPFGTVVHGDMRTQGE